MQDGKSGEQKVGRVLKVEPVSSETTSLYIEGLEHDRFKDRRPGQFATVRILTEEGWSEPHPFTISCAPEEEHLKFTIKSSGKFTSEIPKLKPGTKIRCEGPYGSFCKDIETKEEIVFIAGGVGITPFLSVLRHFRRIRSTNRITLIWANRTRDDAFDLEELEEMTREIDLTVVHVLSRVGVVSPYKENEPERVFYEQGYITGDLLRNYIGSPSVSVYLCGPPKMQDSILQELASCGIPPEKVQREQFTYSAS